MQKRGQLSIFFLMVFVLLIVVSFFIYLNSQEIEVGEEILPADLSSNFKNYVENCIKDVGEDAIYFVALQGGYYKPPSFYKPYHNIKLPYYWDTRNNLMPALEEIEGELAAFVDANLETCLDNFNPFIASGINVEASQPSTEAIITDNNVVFLLFYPLSISKDSTSTTLDSFISKVDINFKDFYSIVYQFMVYQQKNSNVVPISELSSLAYNNDFQFEFINVGIQEVIFSFIFQIPNNKPLIYGFINAYLWEDVGPSKEVLSLQE